MSEQPLQRIKECTKTPPSCPKHIQMAEKWMIFTFKRKQRLGKFHNKCRGNQFSYTPDTSLSIFLPIKQCMKLVRTPTAEECRTYKSPQNWPLSLLSYYIIDCFIFSQKPLRHLSKKIKFETVVSKLTYCLFLISESVIFLFKISMTLFYLLICIQVELTFLSFSNSNM